ncbi:MAG: MFS transporter [Candidatus Berkiellales bacterium]
MKNQTPEMESSFLKPWFIWGLAAFFFFAHYVVRVTPGHITQELQETFIDSTKYEIGLLGASFYLPYVIMQMPVGYLVDRYGSRLLLTVAVLICALSSMVFASATVLSMAMFSRILLGFCSATAFISALKLITIWFEPKKLALLVGITQALGMIGAATGARVVPYLNETIGWQNAFHVYAAVFFVLSIFIYAIVRNAPNGTSLPLPTKGISLSEKISPLSSVIFNRYTWINALYAGMIFAPTDVMGEFWGKEFLEHIHDIDAKQASHAISFLFLGWAVGGPTAGYLADHFGRKPVMIFSAIMGFILLPFIFYVPHLPLWIIMVVVFAYGLTNTGLIACYTVAGELHSKEHSGFSIAISNMFSVLLGAMLMPVLGYLLHWHAHSHVVNGVVEYTAHDYQRSTYILPICLFIAILCAIFGKETLPAKMRE